MVAEKARFLSARGGRYGRRVQSATILYPKTREDSDFCPSSQNARLQNDCAAFPGWGAGNARLFLVERARPHRPGRSRCFRTHLKCQSNRTSC